MAPNAEVDPEEELLQNAFNDILWEPFEDNYDDWHEEPYWVAVEQFKIKSKEMGYDDPLVALASYNLPTYDIIRDKLKEGPPGCFRHGWVSPLKTEKYPEIAIGGINNQEVFSPKPYEPESVSKFLQENKDKFRYTAYIDTAEGHARDTVYNKTEYKAVPCLIVTLDGEVKYVESESKGFRAALEETVKAAVPKEEK